MFSLMSSLIHRAYSILSEEGAGSLFREGADFFSRYPAAAAFHLIDSITETHECSVIIYLRKSSLDGDSLALLIQMSNHSAIEKVYIAVNDIGYLNHTARHIWTKLRSLDIEIQPVKVHSVMFLKALSTSKIVYLRNKTALSIYRIFDCNPERIYAYSYHGIITKAYGNHSPTRDRFSTENGVIPRLSPNPDIKSVGSDVELFYRASAEGADPQDFHKYGYPRFDRIKKFQEGEAQPLLPDQTKTQLKNSNSAYRVLYAPTHRHQFYETPLFPFPDFDIETFRAFLRERDIELYIRMHVNDEESGIYDKYIDSETIYYAGHQFSNAACEILPYFDCLVTDYSSIYIEFIPFDRPIVFLNSDIEEFNRTQGIGYDYEKYFPGEKVDTITEFRSVLSAHQRGIDEHKMEREFVRNVLVPSGEDQFLNQVLNMSNMS